MNHLKRVLLILKEKRASLLPAILALVIGIMMIVYTVAVFAQTAALIRHIRNTGQLTLDRYTVQEGRERLQSFKSGHDYTAIVNPERFRTDFRNALALDDSYICYDANNRIRFCISELDTHFITGRENTVNTQVSFTLEIPWYFMDMQLFIQAIPITIKSTYSIK